MPLDPKLNKFTTAGPANTIFQWEDVIAGIGYNDFFALKNNEGNSLIVTTTPSNDYKTDVPNGATEFNFDHEFLAATDIEGEGYVVITLETVFVAAASPAITAAIRLIHVDMAAAETEIVGTITSDTLTGTAGTESLRVCMTMSVPDTHFAIGEKVRLEIITTSVNNNDTTTIYHDPANRGTTGNDINIGAANRTDLVVTLPFQLPV